MTQISLPNQTLQGIDTFAQKYDMSAIDLLKLLGDLLASSDLSEEDVLKTFQGILEVKVGKGVSYTNIKDMCKHV